MLEELIERLNTCEDDGDCEAAAIALGKMGEVALPHLKAILAQGDADARFWAVRALGAMGTPAAVELLIALLDDADEMVRSGAAWVLGDLQAREAIPSLARLLREEVNSVGQHAADALSKIGEPAVNALVEALSDHRTQARVRAARALVPIESQEAIPALFRALEDESYVVRYYAEEALTRMGVGQIIYFRP